MADRHGRRRDGAGRGAEGAVRHGRLHRDLVDSADRQLGRPLPSQLRVRNQAARRRQPAGHLHRSLPAFQLGAHRGEFWTPVHLRVPRRLPGGEEIPRRHARGGHNERARRLALREPAEYRRRRERHGVRLLRLHHRARDLRPAPHRPDDRPGHGALLCLPVHRPAAPARHRMAGPHRRGRGWRPVRLGVPRPPGPPAGRQGSARGNNVQGTRTPDSSSRAALHKELDDLGL